PEGHRVGSLNEDFAFESLPGDIFQLGNASYRIVKVETGKVLVEDARGQPPSMPFWFGEALGRTDELCHAVSRLNEAADAVLEDSIVLSLGPTHSFALDEVKGYLKSATARDLLVQALLDAPMFGTRWRWNATAALAVRRMNGGKKTPPQFQRSDAQDLLTVVFPDQLACAENLIGEREIPDHPLVAQTLHDCLHDTMDADGFVRLLQRIEAGEVDIATRDLASPSPLSHAILNARPFAFLDDGAAEERRTKTVATKSLTDLQTARDIGKLA